MTTPNDEATTIFTRKPAQAPETMDNAWIGCGECDICFPCHNGQQKCMRLPVEADMGKLHHDGESCRIEIFAVPEGLHPQPKERPVAVAWARPVYARPINTPEAVKGEFVDIQFHNRPEKPEGEGWRPLVFAAPQQPAAVVGEEIMVNAAHDVFILPLQPSGLSSGPRFVVHVPAQPAASAEPARCPHGVRLPHECRECADEIDATVAVAWAEREVQERPVAAQTATELAECRSAVAAPTGKAAQRLVQSLRQESARLREQLPADWALALLERSLAVIQHDIDEIGGCDHSVGICCCELIHLADDIRAALAAQPGGAE